jgi:hypothetical protein
MYLPTVAGAVPCLDLLCAGVRAEEACRARRFCSLFNSYVGLLSGLEDARNLLLVGAGCRGIAPLRAAVEWTPVQAHATAHSTTLVYVAPSALRAAYLKDWCAWAGSSSPSALEQPALRFPAAP